MNIEKKLNKDGIQVLYPLDYITIETLARNVGKKLVSKFPELKLNYNELFEELSHISMYYAIIPEGMSEANYLYKNSSIYFKYGIDEEDLENIASHEIIHYLQTKKDSKNMLSRLGLCDLTGYNIYGLALNEAAVQYMTVKLSDIPCEEVKYYGISLNAKSPLIYPLLVNLVGQLAYLTSDYVLYNSTYYSNDDFKNKLSEIIGEDNFIKIEQGFDKIMFAEEKLIMLSNAKKPNNKKIELQKNIIQKAYIQTQNLIYTSYFNSKLENLFNRDSISNFRKKLFGFRDLLGTTENYTDFDDYYLNTMISLDQKDSCLNNTPYLVPVREKNLLLHYLEKISIYLKRAFQKSY